MARNYVQEGRRLQLQVGAGVKSGEPVVVGQLAGVALTDADAQGQATVQLEGVFALSVQAVDDAGNSAVAVGDAIYFTAADTPTLSKKDTGVLFGYALETVAAGATATIKVRLKG